MTVHCRRRVWWAALVLGVLALAAWLLPGYFGAERYRRRLEAGLEQVLHRPVTFGWASLKLLPRPGFSIDNAVVYEDPTFGSEPFARIDRIECELRWASFWRRRLEFVRLRLQRPSFNVVRNPRGDWNIESLMARSGVASPRDTALSGTELPPPVDVEAKDARLNFKVGVDKKPFAIVDLQAQLNLDPSLGRIQFRISGNPIRSDLGLPPPGILELAGEWRPGPDLGGMMDATLRTRDALLYNWVPLVTGQNPGIYGVIDVDARLHGSLRVVKFEGEASVTRLHRWELLPPADSQTINVRFRGEFDRGRKRALLESVEALFDSTRLHLTGAVDNLPESPELDLVLAVERARLEDLQAISRRLWHYPGQVEVSGRVDGLFSIQGPWDERRYGGFMGAREVRLNTPSGSFPVSELAIRVDKDGARLAPVTIALAPRLGLNVEGAVYSAAQPRSERKANLPARYEVKLAAKSIELGDAVRFARSLGLWSAERLDAQGIGNVTLLLTGTIQPPSRPTLTGKVDIRAARLLVPGLTEPVNIPRVRAKVDGDRIVLEPLTAVMGTSVFTGRLERQGPKGNPWWFDLKANALSVEQAALWFDVLGHRPPLPLLDRIPGLRSLAARHSVASGLFTVLNARGRFETPLLTYRSLTLQDFQASVELSNRILQVSTASFRAGGGRGRVKAVLDLTESPSRVSGEVVAAGVRIQALSNHLPVALRRAHGSISGTAQFETRGLSRSEMSANLQAKGRVHLERVGLGDFDPLVALSRENSWGQLEPARGEAAVRTADISFSIRDRRIGVADQTVDLEGARLSFTGSWGFDGTLQLGVAADLRHVGRPWMDLTPEAATSLRMTRVRLSGPIDQLAVRSEGTGAQASR